MFRRLLCCLILLCAVKSRAQTKLYIEHKGQMYPVRKAVESQPYVAYNGALVRASGERFGLHEADEYLPVLVEVKDIRVSTSNYELMGDGGSLNNQFELRADFSSQYELEDVFLVLDLTLESGKKFIYLREIGHLEPNKSRWLKVDVSLTSPFGAGTYNLHLYAGGDEVLNSQQSPTERAAILDAMVVKRTEKIRAGAPQLFFGSPPVYPLEMAKAKLKGRAVVHFRILSNGKTADPVVREASAPGFGESAINAITQWRFIPKIVNGQGVESEAEIPFAFSAPK